MRNISLCYKRRNPATVASVPPLCDEPHLSRLTCGRKNRHEAQKYGEERLTLDHLDRLEAEAIHIIREAVAEAERPVMLFSGGKDSVVMLHLARKAFFPARPPFPLLHVDTGWKFAELYALRDRLAAEAGMDADRPPQPRGRGARHQSRSTMARRCTPSSGRPRG